MALVFLDCIIVFLQEKHTFEQLVEGKERIPPSIRIKITIRINHEANTKAIKPRNRTHANQLNFIFPKEVSSPRDFLEQRPRYPKGNVASVRKTKPVFNSLSLFFLFFLSSHING